MNPAGLDQHRLRILAVDLEAVAGGVGYDHPVVSRDPYGARRPQDPLWGEVLDAVSLLDHVGIGPELGDAHVGEMSVSRELGDEPAFRCQHLHSVVQPIGHVDVAVRVDRYSRGPVELPGPVAVGAELGDLLTV